MDSSATTQQRESAIAIVGMACDLPDAKSPSQYWQRLCEGFEAARVVEREALLAAGVDPKTIDDSNYVPVSIPLDGFDEFDCSFFGISPREASIMDPQHRRFLQCCWAALEHAGHTPTDVDGSIGVYGGSGMGWYLIRNVLSNSAIVDDMGEFLIRHTANDKDFLTTRVSYHLDLRGPSVNVQTACSTSMVAVHLACQSLLYRECDLALAGGSTIEVPHNVGYEFKEGEIRSNDGHCRAFDASSTGTNFGSGAGVVALRRLDDAIKDGNTIYAVIRGTAINNDGSEKVGYLAPSVEGQVAAITEALAIADVDPNTVGYFETHGTGTTLGDPIEIAALTEAFGATPEKQFCAIGSVKTNFGHLDTAAGVTGLIKVALALYYKQIPASLHFQRPNPEIDFENTPFFVNTRLRDWDPGQWARRAGISSLGVGGTNAHAILEEWDESDDPAITSATNSLIISSGKSEMATASAQNALAAHLDQAQLESRGLADLAYTMAVGRVQFEFRSSAVVSAGELAQIQKAPIVRAPAHPRRAVFMFSGQGTQYPGMAGPLYESEAVFRSELDICLDILSGQLGDVDLRALLLSPHSDAEALQNTAVAQPALFCLEYALARLWQSWGIEPAACIGHSVGEYVAACNNGLFSLEDALSLICARGRLIAALPRGEMLAVPADQSTIDEYLGDAVSIAAVNAPDNVVVSGPGTAIDKLAQKLEQEGLSTRRLKTSHAFHSSMMEPILKEFRELVSRVRFSSTWKPWVSNVTGTWVTEAEATSGEYWARHLRSTVLFAKGVQTLDSEGFDAYIEMGPGDTLMRLASLSVGSPDDNAFINNVPGATTATNHGNSALEALGLFWCSGGDVDWQRYWSGQQRRRVSAPTYQFAPTQCWVEPGKQVAVAREAEQGRQPIDDWFYVPDWKAIRLDPLEVREQAEAVIAMIGEPSNIVTRVYDELTATGADTYLITEGDKLEQIGNNKWTASTGSPEQLLDLFDSIGSVTHVVLALQGSNSDEELLKSFDRLLLIAKALNERDKPVRLQVITDTAFRVNGGRVNPDASLAAALARVVGQELDSVSCSIVDIPVVEESEAAISLYARRITTELFASAEHRVLALRGREVYRECFTKAPIGAADGASLLRPRGTYLISGAFGGLGRLVSEFLAERYNANLVLLGRRAPSSDQSDSDGDLQQRSNTEFVHKLRRLGSEVVTVRGDVRNESDVACAVQKAKEISGDLHGVFHVAGMLDDGLIGLKSVDAAHNVLAPKVFGAIHLDRLTRPHQPEVFVMFSSLSAIAGLAGQADYAAANAFLDSFANARGGEVDTQYLAVDWSVWRGIGMAQSLSVAEKLGDSKSWQPISHPLFTHAKESHSGATLVAPISTKACWYVDEHRLAGGDAVMPGAGFIEIILTAYRSLQPSGSIELCDLEFLSPLIVRDDENKVISVELVKTQESGAYDVTVAVISGGEAIQDCVTCTARATDSLKHSQQGTGINHLIRNEQRAAPEHAGLRFGARWACIVDKCLAEHTAEIQIALDSRFDRDLLDTIVHPALLDVAMAGAQELARGESTGQYAPFIIRSFELHAPLPANFTSTVTQAEHDGDRICFDSVVTDDSGSVLVKIDGLAMRKLPGDWSSRPTSDNGMTAQPDNALLSVGLETGIDSREGCEVLERLLAQPGPPQVIVSPLDLDTYLAGLREGNQVESDDEAEEVTGGISIAPRPDLSVAYAAPENDSQRQLAQIWEAGLGLGPVGVDDNFFELGGHSLLLSQLVARMRKKHSVRIPIDRAFECPTIRLWSELATAKSAESAPEVVRVDRQSYRGDASVLGRLQ